MTTDHPGENDFDNQPIEGWFPEPERTATPDADGPQLEPPSKDVGSKRRRFRRKMIASVVLVAALVVAGVAAWLVLGAERNGADDVDDDLGVADTSPDAASSVPNALSSTDSPVFPTLGSFDSFSRSDSDELGITQSGREWVEVAGAWNIESQSALVSQPNSDGPSIAVADSRAIHSVVQVTMPSVERAAGLVFRYANQYNYWSMTAAPASGTWVISQVSQGESVVVRNLGSRELRTIQPSRFARMRIPWTSSSTARRSRQSLP